MLTSDYFSAKSKLHRDHLQVCFMFVLSFFYKLITSPNRVYKNEKTIFFCTHPNTIWALIFILIGHFAYHYINTSYTNTIYPLLWPPPNSINTPYKGVAYLHVICTYQHIQFRRVSFVVLFENIHNYNCTKTNPIIYYFLHTPRHHLGAPI